MQSLAILAFIFSLFALVIAISAMVQIRIDERTMKALQARMDIVLASLRSYEHRNETSSSPSEAETPQAETPPESSA